MNIRFDEQTVFVTGAHHGFGRGLTETFVRLGAHVYASDIIMENQGQTDTGSGRLSTKQVDVTDPEAVSDWILSAIADTGRADILVNNAGGVLGQTGQPLENVSAAAWHAIFAVNLDGVFHTTRAIVNQMKTQGRGRIVNISSGAGLGVSLTGIQAYASAKAGQIGLTRQLAHELGPWGITVNSVAPGFVLSNPATERQWASYGPIGQERLVNAIALRRLGTVEDIVSGVLFLASEYAGWITGQTLPIDGGK